MRYSIFLLCAMVSVLLAGCISPGQPDVQPKPTTIKVAINDWAGFAPLYIAQQQNLFGTGVSIELVQIVDPGQTRAAFMSHKIDVYSPTYDMYHAGQGNFGQIVAVLDRSNGGDGLVVDSSIQKASDLRGKNFVTEGGRPAHFLLQYYLHQNNMSFKDIELIDMPTNEGAIAYISNKTNGAGLYQPHLSKAIEGRSGSYLLYSTASEPGVTDKIIADVLVARKEMTQQNPQALKAIMDGWFAALAYIQTHPDEAYTIMAKQYGMSTGDMKALADDVVWSTLEDNKEGFLTMGTGSASYIFDLVGTIMFNNGLIKNPLSSKDIISSDVIVLY